MKANKRSIQFRLDPDMIAEMDVVCERLHLQKSDLVRILVADFLAGKIKLSLTAGEGGE